MNLLRRLHRWLTGHSGTYEAGRATATNDGLHLHATGYRLAIADARRIWEEDGPDALKAAIDRYLPEGKP